MDPDIDMVCDALLKALDRPVPAGTSYHRAHMVADGAFRALRRIDRAVAAARLTLDSLDAMQTDEGATAAAAAAYRR